MAKQERFRIEVSDIFFLSGYFKSICSRDRLSSASQFTQRRLILVFFMCFSVDGPIYLTVCKAKSPFHITLRK